MPSPENKSVHKYLRDRAILIGLPISDALASDVLEALSFLEKQSHAPITIYLNSPGGLALACEKIIGGISDSPAIIHTHCVGLAAAGAAHIFTAGYRRIAVSDACIFFTHFSGNDFVDTSAIEETRKRFVSRTCAALNVTEETLDLWMTEKCYFSGMALIEYGIAHEIV